MTITSRGQFPGSLTLSCMRTIAYCIQNFQKNVTKSKNTAQMQKLPAADDESAAGSFCFNYLYQAILEQEGVFSVIPVQNIPHIAQTVAVQQRFRLGRGNLPAYDLDWAARIDDGNR